MSLINVLFVFSIVQRALASLNCTLVVPTATERFCEWEGCQPFTTVTAGSIVHATCRANCSSDDDPWYKLYNGAFIKVDDLKNCNYFGVPWPASGLPRCWEEQLWSVPATSLPAPTNCAASSMSGTKSQIPTPTPPGPEDPPISVLLSGYPGYIGSTELLHSTVTAVNFSSGSVPSSSSTSSNSSASASSGSSVQHIQSAAPGRHLDRALAASLVLAVCCVAGFISL